MLRFAWAAALAVACLAPPVWGETMEERVDRLERELAAERARHAKEVEGLTRRLEALETAAPESELDRLIREAEERAGPPEALGGPGPIVTGQTLLNAFNPRITLFGDFVYRLDTGKVHAHAHDHDAEEHEEEEEGEEEGEEHHEGPRIDDRASLRSIELDFRADVDPFAKAVAILGIHEELPGEYELHPEEVYVTFETLPWGLHARAGKYLASFGTMNRLHPHDFPQATAPLFLDEWFGHEGLNSTGAELSWLLPQDLLDSVELLAGVMNGEQEVFAGSDSNDPAWLGRAQLFETLSDSSFLSAGTSHLYGKTDEDGHEAARVSGVDVLWRWRPAGDRSLEHSLVVQAEAYHLTRKSAKGETARGFGGYALVQYQPRRDVYLGVRCDTVDPTEEFEGGKARALGAWLTFYTSEFLRFRIGYEHRSYRGGDRTGTLWLQMTFVFGSHPVEPYWFNK